MWFFPVQSASLDVYRPSRLVGPCFGSTDTAVESRIQMIPSLYGSINSLVWYCCVALCGCDGTDLTESDRSSL